MPLNQSTQENYSSAASTLIYKIIGFLENCESLMNIPAVTDMIPRIISCSAKFLTYWSHLALVLNFLLILWAILTLSPSTTQLYLLGRLIKFTCNSIYFIRTMQWNCWHTRGNFPQLQSISKTLIFYVYKRLCFTLLRHSDYRLFTLSERTLPESDKEVVGILLKNIIFIHMNLSDLYHPSL